MRNSILVVDDNAPIRQMLRAVFEADGFTIVGEAANGVEAVNLVSTVKPDLIVLDLSMPVMNGLQAAPLLRRSLQNVPIILLTLYASVLPAEIAKPAGIAAVLSKDGSLDKLIPTAKALLSQAA